MLNPRVAVLVFIVLAAALTRLMPHPPNMTSIAAIALFGGAYFSDRWLAFLVPLTALFISDMALGGFYRGMEVVYLSFALIVCIGLWLQKYRTVLPIAGAALAGSVLFFVLTNLGVWAFSGMYPATVEGLAACFTAAIPFFANTVMGDLFYTALLFGGFALLESQFGVLQKPSRRKLHS